MPYKLAIDFGTTNSVLAVWDELTQAARVLSIPGMSYQAQDDGARSLIPSLLYVQDGLAGQVVVGQSVIDNGLTRQRDNRLFRNFKRGILTQSNESPRLIDGTLWTERDAGRRFLKELLAALPQSLPGSLHEIDQLLLTVPVAAFDSYMSWLSEGVEQFLTEHIRLLDEATAAALGYSVTEPSALVLVFDFGGGSLDLSLVQLPQHSEKVGGLLNKLRGKATSQHTARVIAKAGLPLGGSDIDHWLLNTALQRIGFDQQQLGMDYAALLTICESAKVELSTMDTTTLSVSIGGHAHEMMLQRAELEALMRKNGFFEAIKQVADKVMHAAHRKGIYKEDIHHVLLVGGTSLIPCVQHMLREYFFDSAVKVGKPFTAVAEGALQLAAGFGLDDYLIHSYGLRYLDEHSGKHRYDEIIPMGCRYPMSHPVEVLLGASHAGQQAVEFVVGEIQLDNIESVEVNYEDGQAVFIAHASMDSQQIVPLNQPQAQTNLALLEPPGTPGEQRLVARFLVDGSRHLRLSVTDLQNKRELIQNSVLVFLGEQDLIEKMAQYSTHKKDLTGFEPALVQARSWSERRISLRKLGTILNMLPPDAISLDVAIEALKSDDFYVRYRAADLLGRRNDRDSRMIMEDILLHGAAPQRAVIAHHLHQLSWYVAGPLLHRALQDHDLRVRESAVYALCQLRSSDAYQLLLAALESGEEALLQAAAWGLSRAPEPASLPVLQETLRSSNPEVRSLTLEAMAATGTVGALPSIRRALADQDLDVKYAATLSWIELAGPACFSDLAGYIQKSCAEERLAFVRGLFHATNYLLIPIADSPDIDVLLDALQQALQDELSAVRQFTLMLLAWMRDERSDALLQKGFRNEKDADVKAHMLYAAVSLKSPCAQDLLLQSLNDPMLPVRQTAQQLAKTRNVSRLDIQ